MQSPDTPQDETTRLRTLRHLGVLDTPAEERFDRLTRLAKRLFDVPIALVSLVDENRQWFKSKDGLGVDETSREVSFCGHAILGDDILLVPDAVRDQRFADNPLVLDDPNIRFYAGCPLVHVDGSKLGTLCIIDTQPREFSDDELLALKDLAGVAERELAAVQLATVDDLTRISNRQGFIALARHALGLCSRTKVSASLVFLDLNKFKPINDRFGHAEGDAALTAFASLMKKSFRESDVIARLGGDEFVALLTGTNSDRAEEVVSRFRDAIDSYNRASERGYDITFSDGIVTVDHDHKQTIESILSSADSLMYEDKLKRRGEPVY